MNRGPTMISSVAVLFARSDSIYKSMPSCDVYDIERDAKSYNGILPVIAHPPCRSWGRMRKFANPRQGEKELARWAVDVVRKNGGVLEHPKGSRLWLDKNLPEGQEVDEFGGYTLHVDQCWWGHRARKATKLYICGCKISELPVMPFSIIEPSHVVGRTRGARRRPEITKKEREATPLAFAEWLKSAAMRCTNV